MNRAPGMQISFAALWYDKKGRWDGAVAHLTHPIRTLAARSATKMGHPGGGFLWERQTKKGRSRFPSGMTNKEQRRIFFGKDK